MPSHPHRNVLTRALGIGTEIELDATALAAVAGDRFLLCSDGLHREVKEEHVASLLAGADDIQAAADGLVEMALSAGGRDNVAVVVTEICA